MGIDEKEADPSHKTLLVKDPNPELNETSPPVWAIDASKLGDAELEILKGGEREFMDGRAAASSFEAWQAGVFAVGRSLVDWNSRNMFCAGCGSKVVSRGLTKKGGCARSRRLTSSLSFLSLQYSLWGG